MARFFWAYFFLLSKKERCLFKLFLCASLAIVFERVFDLHHTVERHVLKCYIIMDPNGHRQWTSPPPRVYPEKKKLQSVRVWLMRLSVIIK